MQILETVGVLLRGEDVSEWAAEEGREAMTQPHYRDNPLYQVWAGTLRGEAAINELVAELARWQAFVCEKTVARLLDAATLARAELARGALYAWNGESHTSALVALAKIADDAVDQLQLLQAFAQAEEDGLGNPLLICREIDNRTRWFDANVGQADLYALLNGVEQECVWIERANQNDQQKQDATSRPPNAEPQDSPPFIISLGERRYRVGDGNPTLVTEREDTILQAFLERSPLDKPAIGEVSGYAPEEAIKVLRQLKGTEKRAAKYNGVFADAIKLPGSRGSGGYHVSIRAAT